MFKRICSILGFIGIVGAALTTPLAAQPQGASPQIHLRRATFDPMRVLPRSATPSASIAQSRLRLVQLTTPADETTEAQLRAAGLEPLAYVPDQAYVVRVHNPTAPISFPGMRWSGPFLPDYKRSPTLDAIETAADEEIALSITVPRDTAIHDLEAAITQSQGHITSQQETLNGLVLHATLPAAAVQQLVARDDVLWVERWSPPRLLNDRGREIMRVEDARGQVPWLTGSGQIVAVSDTGLDVQQQVVNNQNPDFPANKIVQGSKNYCGVGDWSDSQGHGTHVTGTILGTGRRLPSRPFAGVAPDTQVVVQTLSTGSSQFCFFSESAILNDAYSAGARIQNASWGTETFGEYDTTASTIDDFLWKHKDHVFVVAAGNSGQDIDNNGVVDNGSINSPATAKNVISVGATEGFRPEQPFTWSSYPYLYAPPVSNDLISDDIDGMAGFSSRGPTNDGRLKPDLVAPGTMILSARTHATNKNGAQIDQQGAYNEHYGYKSGTSMATPMVSGAAALVRQWLAQAQGITQPSAALIKALLLNGATDIAPGQYGDGPSREIPQAWPNNVEGWGRANVASSIGLQDNAFRFVDKTSGLTTGGVEVVNTGTLEQGQLIRVTLAWTDYPAAELAAKTLVNDLDLEITTSEGELLARGNAAAQLPTTCRNGGADRCNNVEGIEFIAPRKANYIVRVRGVSVPRGPQPFALVVGTPAPETAPTNLRATTTPNTPSVTLQWDQVAGASFYEVYETRGDLNASEGETQQHVLSATSPSIVLVEDPGVYRVRVRACNSNGCGPLSGSIDISVVTSPHKAYLPLMEFRNE